MKNLIPFLITSLRISIIISCHHRPVSYTQNSFINSVFAQIKCPRKTWIYCIVLSFLMLDSTGVVFASNDEQEKLEELRKQIQQLQTELQAENREKDRAVYLLQQSETQVSRATRKVNAAQSDLDTVQQKISILQKKEKQLRQQLSQNRGYLIDQIRASYSMGRQEYIKLLLNQENPSSVARMVTYYQYFNRARSDQLQRIDSRLVHLKKVSEDIREQSDRLSGLKQVAIRERELLQSKRKERSEIVASLSHSLREKNNRLNSLLRDEQHLKKLLDKIESQLNDVNLDLSPPKKFRQLKGNLSWPAKGSLKARFGSVRKNSGNLKWKGVLIGTEPGNAIKAVAYGRVVFADWLRGFGLLIIVDHGEGYMSLYGHNEQLHKKLGDWVQPDEVIASSGNSGGQVSASLYFEIRHRGKPQDPVKWCKALPKSS